MKNIVDISIFLILQFVFISMILIYLYHGGSVLHPNAESFIFSENFLNDLGRYYYYNGNINPFGIFFTLSLTLFGVGTATFFYVISKFCHQRRYIPLVFGVISGMSLIGFAVYWSDITHDKHIFFGRLAYLSFFIASLSLSFYLKKQYFPDVYYALIFLNLSLFLFLIFMFLIDSRHFSMDSEQKLRYTAIMQKFIITVRISVMVYILYVLKKLNKKINIL